jgi:hypothetical protein
LLEATHNGAKTTQGLTRSDSQAPINCFVNSQYAGLSLCFDPMEVLRPLVAERLERKVYVVWGFSWLNAQAPVRYELSPP